MNINPIFTGLCKFISTIIYSTLTYSLSVWTCVLQFKVCSRSKAAALLIFALIAHMLTYHIHVPDLNPKLQFLTEHIVYRKSTRAPVIRLPVSWPTFGAVMRKLKWPTNFPPQCVKDGSVWKDADQPVLHSDVMEERLLGVNDERVRDPEQLHQPPIQAQALISLKN